MATTKKRGRPAKVIKDEASPLAEETFVISVDTGETVVTGTGPTMLDALKSLEAPVKIVRKTVISLSHGDKSTEFVYTIPRAKRIFYPITRHITAKHFSLLLK